MIHNMKLAQSNFTWCHTDFVQKTIINYFRSHLEVFYFSYRFETDVTSLVY